MLGTFLGLETATLGLQAQQAAMDTASHNISNANTPGYSRQVVDTVASPALTLTGPALQVGTGVQVQQIQRVRDSYLDSQYRDQNQMLGNWQSQQSTLQNVSSIINEPSSTGISTVMQNFWNSWDQLSTNPSDLSARSEVVQSAVTVAQTLNQTANQLSDLQSNLQSNLNGTVNQVNSYISQIASLNKQIDSATASGAQPNDLMDQRDHLVDKLSSLANVSVKSDSTTPYQLSIGNTVVLNDASVVQDPTDATKPLLQVTTASGQLPTLSVPVSGGQLAGILTSMSTVQGYQSDLNAFANGLANGQSTITLSGDWTIAPSSSGSAATLPVQVTLNGTTYAAGTPLSTVAAADSSITQDSSGDYTIPQGTVLTVAGLNAMQAMGFDENGNPGGAFFTTGSAPSGSPITASDITVNPSVVSDVSTVAAGFSKNAGDGTLAMTTSSYSSAQVQFQDISNPSATMPLTKGTLNGFMQAVVGQLGIQGQQADQEVSNQQSLVQQVDAQRQSVSGVSIDEEMANVVQFQQAYDASAKVISVINSMLTTLIQNT